MNPCLSFFRLDYCNYLFVWDQLCPFTVSSKCSSQTAHCYSNVPHHTILRTLHWLPVRHKTNFKTLLIEYKSLNGQPPCARFIAREDPHSKCIKCLGFSHARDAVYGTSTCKICKDFRLITLRSQLEACEKESSIFPHRAPGTPRPLVRSRPLVRPWPGVRMSSSRRWRVSRQASPFLSLPLPSACARIHQLNSCMIFYFLARGHVIPFPSG